MNLTASSITLFDPKAAAGTDLGQTAESWYHFSIDDVFDSLIEATDKGIPLFEQPMFALLKEMHDAYGTCVGLNLFFQKEINGKVRSLKEVRDLRAELVKDGGWLKFAPHALDFDTAPYDQQPSDQIETFDRIYEEIDRFAGKEFYARWIRLHYYSESYELADYFTSRGVRALFSTDRPVGSHRMPDDIKKALSTAGCATYQGMNFIRTQFRIEFFVDQKLGSDTIRELLQRSLKTYGYVIIYTHEYEFARPEIQDMIRLTFRALSDSSIVSMKTV